MAAYELESDVFTNPIRAQLTTTATKPCTYFADKDGKRVFVKGPYASEQQARVPLLVYDFKSLFDDVSLTPLSVEQFIPDGMSDCQFGARMWINKEQPHWFQIADDVLKDEETLPVHSRSSPKAWPVPVEVVDWSKVENYSHVEYNKSYSKTIFKTDKKAARMFVKHIILSWICGAGADMAMRNFIYDKKHHVVYQVDHEAWLKFDWAVSDTQAGSSRTKAWSHLEKFIKSDFKYFDTFFASLVDESVITKLKEKFPERMAVLLEERLNEVAADWTVIASVVETTNKVIEEPVEPPPATPLKRKVEDEPTTTIPPPGPKKAKVVAVTRPATPVPVNFNIPEYIGKLYVGLSTPTFRVATDPWGFTVNLRKSDMQKAIRRGNHLQAMVAFASCVNIARIYPDDPNAKRIFTNMLNRVAICAMEDIGVANVPLVMHVVKRVLDLTTTNTYDVTRVIPYTMKLIYNLCQSQKTRVQSHIAHAYHPKNHKQAREAGLTVTESPVDLKDPNWFGVAEVNPGKAWAYFRERQPLIHKFYMRMSEKNKPAALRFALSVEYFKTPSHDLEAESWTFASIPYDVPVDDIYNNLVRMDPLECAYDKHTNEGRHKSLTQFKTEGTRLYRECHVYSNTTYKHIYLNSNA